MPTQPSAPARHASIVRVLGLVGAALLIAWLAVVRVAPYRYPLDVAAALAGAGQAADATVDAALRSWLLLAAGLGAVAYAFRRWIPDCTAGEALAAAIAMWWSVAYLALVTLGPLGLHRAAVLRGLDVVGILAVLTATRRTRRPIASSPMGPADDPAAGSWLLGLAIALSVGPLVLLQVASPVSPFMDVLGYIAPIQKIVTFERFDPYANDAAGLWSPTRQVVGFDAAFAHVALATGLPARLAMSSLIVPLALFQLGALYLVARVAGGRAAGGTAALLLLQTFVWRRTTDVRSTGVAFPLIAVGLAFLFHCRREGVRAAVAGLALGVSVTVSPLIGAVGMAVGAVATVAEWLDRARPPWTPILALAGGSLLALPQVAIGLALAAPPWLLPLPAWAGLALLWAVSRRAPDGPRRALAARPLAVLVIALLPLAVLLLHARRQSEFFNDNWFGYPVLVPLGLAGLVVTAWRAWRREDGLALPLPAIALWLGIAIHAIADPQRFTGALETRSLASEVTTKMVYYWWPYWLAIAAGSGFGVLAPRWSPIGTAILVLGLVVYPWRLVSEPLDFDTQQLSVVENWGFQLTNAARGYHAGRPDRRWVLDQGWREVTDRLMRERAEGRIDYYTHVVVVSPAIDTVELALWTGISVDLITPQYDPQSIWTGNGRARGMETLPAVLAQRPRYVLVQGYPPSQFPELAAYDELIKRPLAALFRLRE